MSQREEITAELAQIDPSMSLWPYHMPYSLPFGYFEGITGKLLEQSVVGLMVEKSRGYQVPAGYFNQLSDRIMAAIHKQAVANELEEIAPLLNTISKQMPYTSISLPQFQMEGIMEKAAEAAIPVIQMPVRKKNKWMQYAAAAVATGVIVVTAYMYNSRSENNSANINYAQLDVSHEISRLSEEELNTYLATSEKMVINTGDRDVYGIEALPEVDEHIEMSSDDELKQYLDESTEVSGEAKADTNSES